MANGAPGGTPTMPNGWIDTASKLIIQVGFPVVVASVLLWFLLTKFQDNMLVITDRMAKNTVAADSLVRHQAALVEQEKLIFGELQGQTAALKQQGELMVGIAKDAHDIVELNKNRLDALKVITEMQKKKEPKE